MHQTLASAVKPLTAFPRFMPFPISAFTSGPFPLPFPLSFPLSFPVHFRFHFRFHFHVFRSISAFVSTSKTAFISGPFPAHCRFHFRFHFRPISAFISGSCPLSFSVHFRKISGPFPVHCPFWQNQPNVRSPILIRD